jgi:hypothetical protein
MRAGVSSILFWNVVFIVPHFFSVRDFTADTISFKRATNNSFCCSTPLSPFPAVPVSGSGPDDKFRGRPWSKIANYGLNSSQTGFIQWLGQIGGSGI